MLAISATLKWSSPALSTAKHKSRTVIWCHEKSPKIGVNSCQIWLNPILWMICVLVATHGAVYDIEYTMTEDSVEDTFRNFGPVEASPKAELIGVMMMHIGMPTVASKRSKSNLSKRGRPWGFREKLGDKNPFRTIRKVDLCPLSSHVQSKTWNHWNLKNNS